MATTAKIDDDSPAGGIELQAVSKRYGGAGAPLVVDAVDVRVPRGTLTTLLGPSGCGKTTTLRMIAGLEAPTSGRIVIAGRDVTDLPASERDVSMVFQSYALFPHMNVLANVSYGLGVAGMARPQAREKARAAMATVGLVDLDERLPSELSGGQQQRVALARALVLEPAVLLFDEPLSNLDARLRRSMREEIRGLQQRLGLTVAYVTHDQEEAMAVSDQVIVMNRGRIAQAGTPRELYERPQSEFVAGFMGEAVLFDALALADGTLRLGPLAIRPAAPCVPGPVRLAIRPEAWQVRPAGSGGLAATVAETAYLGSVRETTFATELGAIFVVSADGGSSLRAGDVASLDLGAHGHSVLPD
ncbi:MAG TPA: ABC transporter ATP-binding protein [Caldimonas sp.]|jgi:iron(III) transport system ATP-binding protein|nr:ABC transporter ATP-binding protein [Caldimonas sp.]